MKFLAAFAAIAAVALAEANPGDVAWPTSKTTISIPPLSETSQVTALETRVISKLSSFQAQETTKSEYSAFMSALSSAAGSSAFNALTRAPTNADEVASLLATATSQPTWWTKLPDSAQSYYTSEVGAVESVLADALTGAAAPTGMPGVRAAMVAVAGAVGGAALLL
jgi:hypothetical protein